MTKRETAQALVAASSAAKLQEVRARMEEFRTARTSAALDLASVIEPLAEAIVLLTEEAETTLQRLPEAMKKHDTAITERAEQMEKTIAALEEMTPVLVRTSRRLEGGKASGPKPWALALLPCLLAPVIAAASIACWIWLDGPAMLSGNSELLALARQVQQRYQQMTPERQGQLQELLSIPGGR